MTKRDYYEILSVSKTATEIEIKKAYRVVAKKYHPDLNPGDDKAAELFKEAAEAYDVLSNSQKRQMYDQYGHEGLSGRGAGFQSAEDVFSSFGDIFESFFGGGGGRSGRSRGPRQGADLQSRLGLTFEEAVFGTKKTIRIERQISCDACDGNGSEPGHEPQKCPTCDGMGKVRAQQGFFTMTTACPRCHGQGQWVDHPCKTCDGQGRKIERKDMEVDVPAGVDRGLQIRLDGQGDAGHRGGTPGDLYVVLDVEESDRFRRQDEHLYADLKIGMAQAALGTDLEVQTLEGKEKIHIKPGTQPGDVQTLRGHGVPRLQRQGRGNLYLEVQVMMPKRLTTRQEELLRDFAEESGEKVAEAKPSFFEKLKKKAGCDD